jgi:hypothetical protein
MKLKNLSKTKKKENSKSEIHRELWQPTSQKCKVIREYNEEPNSNKFDKRGSRPTLAHIS